jgi:hypothetical protein
MTPSPRPSPRWGEGKGEGFRILNLGIGAYWGFGAWNLVLAALKLTESKMLLIETGHAH